jgi:hypothetical protein
MRFRSSEKVITRDDIKRFATEFDPQPYHLDETAAERTPLKTAPFVGPWRRRIAVACPSAAWRCPPPRRRGNRAHTIKNEASRNCSDQMDSFQSTWRGRVHVYSDRHRAVSAGLIYLARVGSGPGQLRR